MLVRMKMGCGTSSTTGGKAELGTNWEKTVYVGQTHRLGSDGPGLQREQVL